MEVEGCVLTGNFCLLETCVHRDVVGHSIIKYVISIKSYLAASLELASL